MEKLKPLETKLAELFKSAPPLGESAVKTIVSYAPILALIGGVLQGLSALWLFNLSRDYNNAVTVVNNLTAAVGNTLQLEKLNLFYWVSMAVLVCSAALLLLSYSGLKARKKSGWNYLFAGVLLNFAYGVFSVLDNSSRGGIGSLFISVIVAAFGLYILFQIRSHYGSHGVHKPEHKQPE